MWGDQNRPINRIMAPQLYTSAQAAPGAPVEQFVDDYEVWDNFPADAHRTEVAAGAGPRHREVAGLFRGRYSVEDQAAQFDTLAWGGGERCRGVSNAAWGTKRASPLSVES